MCEIKSDRNRLKGSWGLLGGVKCRSYGELESGISKTIA